MTNDKHLKTLRDIAALLRVPVSTFFDAPDAAGSEQIRRATETILSIMAGIPDPGERARCLDRVLRRLDDPSSSGDGSGGD